jgi:hypothetical protein
MKTGTVFRVDGTWTEVAPQNPRTGYKLEEMYKLIGADMIEIVPAIGPGMILVCDENGWACGKKINRAASMFAGQPIVGDALLCQSKHVK